MQIRAVSGDPRPFFAPCLRQTKASSLPLYFLVAQTFSRPHVVLPAISNHANGQMNNSGNSSLNFRAGLHCSRVIGWSQPVFICACPVLQPALIWPERGSPCKLAVPSSSPPCSQPFGPYPFIPTRLSHTSHSLLFLSTSFSRHVPGRLPRSAPYRERGQGQAQPAYLALYMGPLLPLPTQSCLTD